MTALVGSVAVASTAGLAVAVLLAPHDAWPPPAHNWWLRIAVFAAVSTVPHWFVEAFAWVTVALGEDLKPSDHSVGFNNPGAFLGLVERVLFLGSLVAGYPEFIAVWFVLKGIAGWKEGGTDLQAGRRFQLLLLNNAVSLAGVALGWLVWTVLGLPVLRH